VTGYFFDRGWHLLRLLGLTAICILLLLPGCESAPEPEEALGTLLISPPPPPPSAKASGIDTSEALYRAGLAYKEAGKVAWAAKRYQEAAALNHAAATYALAIAYRAGEGVGQDSEKAKALTRRAAQLGNPQANYVLGVAHYLESGDTTAAIGYLMQSADKNFSHAEYLLGRLYALGQGVERDMPWALRWYGLAAAHGHREAQFLYGSSMLPGGPGPEDLDESVFWLGLAALQGHERASAQLRELEIEPDPKTLAAFARRLSHISEEMAPLDEQPATVRYVQIKLKSMGLYDGRADGMLGPGTESAIEDYWRAHGGDGDAGIDNRLLQALNTAS